MEKSDSFAALLYGAKGNPDLAKDYVLDSMDNDFTWIFQRLFMEKYNPENSISEKAGELFQELETAEKKLKESVNMLPAVSYGIWENMIRRDYSEMLKIGNSVRSFFSSLKK